MGGSRRPAPGHPGRSSAIATRRCPPVMQKVTIARWGPPKSAISAPTHRLQYPAGPQSAPLLPRIVTFCMIPPPHGHPLAVQKVTIPGSGHGSSPGCPPSSEIGQCPAQVIRTQGLWDPSDRWEVITLLSRRPTVLVASLLSALFMASECTGGTAKTLASRPTVTEQAARDLLAQAVDHTLNRDFRSLCGLAGSRNQCENDLRNGALEHAPQQPPTVVCSYELPDVVSARGRSLGGRVPVVDGVDGSTASL